jgi:protein-L-isoaspartate(D-aspartate) O-methyltransferase
LSDGSWGLAREAPFEAIIATAAPETVPPELLEQLAVGGKLIIPVGKQGVLQTLQVITRETSESYTTVTHEAVQFVPMIQAKT